MSAEKITRGSNKRIRVQFIDQNGDVIPMDTAGYLGTGQIRWDGEHTTVVVPTGGSNFTWTDQANGIGFFHWTMAETNSATPFGVIGADRKDGKMDLFVWYSATENYPVGSIRLLADDPSTVTAAAQS